MEVVLLAVLFDLNSRNYTRSTPKMSCRIPLFAPFPSADTSVFPFVFLQSFQNDFVWLKVGRLRDVVTANGDLAVQNSDAIKEATSTVHLLMRWNHSNHLDALGRISMNFRQILARCLQIRSWRCWWKLCQAALTKKTSKRQ